MKHDLIDLDMTRKVCDLVLREREIALSDREWKFRLRGYGYAIKDTDHGCMITSLLKNNEICELPTNMQQAA